MKIIDQYILKKVLSTFFFVMLMLTAVIVVITITEKMDAFARNNLSTVEIIGYYLDFIPWVCGQLAPITVFIATVFVTSRMAAHTEIIAILSGGTSFKRLLLPYFISALLIAGASFYFNGWVIPQSNRSRLDFELKYLENKTSYDRRNLHMQIAPNVNLYIQSYNNITEIGYMFSLERFENGMLIEKLTADNIQWDTTKQKWKLKRWTLKKIEAMFEQTSTTGSYINAGDALDTSLVISPKDFENETREYDGMTINELDETIAKKRFRGLSGIEFLETEKHIRYAMPFTTFILVFIGVVVSSRKSRGGTGFQIALGFLMAFIFILFFTLARTFSEAGSLPPVVAAWLPNVAFTAISVALYKYIPR